MIWPAGSPERWAWARRVAAKAKAAGVTAVLIKVADGQRPYNVRWKDTVGKYGKKNQVYYNSTQADAVDDLPELVEAFHELGIRVIGWQFVYLGNEEAQAMMAIRRMRELKLDGWVVNAEFSHKSFYEREETIIEGKKKKKVKKQYEYTRPQPDMLESVDAYMLPMRAETSRLGIWLGLSTYKYPSSHPSFPFAAFLQYCDVNLPQVYPLGDLRSNAHSLQLAKSLKEYRAISETPIYPTGAACSEGGWLATAAQVTDFFEACEREGLEAAGLWEWSQMDNTMPLPWVSRPELWKAMADYVWPGDESPVEAPPEPVKPGLGAGDPAPVDWHQLFNDFRVRVRH